MQHHVRPAPASVCCEVKDSRKSPPGGRFRSLGGFSLCLRWGSPARHWLRCQRAGTVRRSDVLQLLLIAELVAHGGRCSGSRSLGQHVQGRLRSRSSELRPGDRRRDDLQVDQDPGKALDIRQRFPDYLGRFPPFRARSGRFREGLQDFRRSSASFWRSSADLAVKAVRICAAVPRSNSRYRKIMTAAFCRLSELLPDLAAAFCGGSTSIPGSSPAFSG